MGLLLLVTTASFLWAMNALVEKMDIPEDHKMKVFCLGFVPVIFLSMIAAEEWRKAILPG